MTRTAAAAKTRKSTQIATKIADDGLRYTKKATGSPFVGNHGGFSGNTLSCLFCGVHRRPNERITQRVFGHNQQVCEPPCPTNPRARRLAAQVATATPVTRTSD